MAKNTSTSAVITRSHTIRYYIQYFSYWGKSEFVCNLENKYRVIMAPPFMYIFFYFPNPIPEGGTIDTHFITVDQIKFGLYHFFHHLQHPTYYMCHLIICMRCILWSSPMLFFNRLCNILARVIFKMTRSFQALDWSDVFISKLVVNWDDEKTSGERQSKDLIVTA